jgi:hypothetical protein
MNTKEIDEILYSNLISKQFYQGCYPCDIVPEPLKYPATFVVNNDDSLGPGEHWVAVYIPNPDTLYYFDSLNGEPNECLFEYLNKFKILLKNNVRVQSLFSDSCAHFCIYFVIQISKGYSFDYIMNKLIDMEDLEWVVNDYVSKIVW